MKQTEKYDRDIGVVLTRELINDAISQIPISSYVVALMEERERFNRLYRGIVKNEMIPWLSK